VDFNPEWFDNIGGTICITVVFQMITPHLFKIIKAIHHKLKRIVDKGGLFVNLRVGDSDDVNTK
jgi:hypothetical protein